MFLDNLFGRPVTFWRNRNLSGTRGEFHGSLERARFAILADASPFIPLGQRFFPSSVVKKTTKHRRRRLGAGLSVIDDSSTGRGGSSYGKRGWKKNSDLSQGETYLERKPASPFLPGTTLDCAGISEASGKSVCYFPVTQMERNLYYKTQEHSFRLRIRDKRGCNRFEGQFSIHLY